MSVRPTTRRASDPKFRPRTSRSGRCQVTPLEGGPTVITAAMPHRSSVSAGIWVSVGGRHEPASLGGISHFIEHMLFKGTRSTTAAQISEAIEGIGGYLNAFTDEEHTCFYARARGRDLPVLVDVLLDMCLDSRLAPAEIARERTVVEEEIAMYRDQPAEHVHDVLNALQFPGHPLGRAVIGSPKTVRSFRQRHLKAFLKGHYTAGATTIVATGDVDHGELVRLLEPHRRRFNPGSIPENEPAPPAGTSPRLRQVVRDTEQSHMSLGIRTCSRHDTSRFALRLLSVILGENMSSRLFQVVRERHGLTYSIQTTTSLWEDCGDLVVSAGMAPRELSRTLRLVRQEFDRIRRTAPDPAELERARDYLVGQHELHVESTEHHMMHLGEHWLGHGALPCFDTTQSHLLAVQPSDIRRAAEQFLDTRRMSLALVGPRADANALGRILEG